jgi:hypothetical protein
MLGASAAALASLKAAVAACALPDAVACFGPDEASAGLRLANELRAIFLPLLRVQKNAGAGAVAVAPSRGIRGGAKRVASSVARAAAPLIKAGDPLAFGTPNSAFRRPPLRLAVSADPPLRSVSLRAWLTFSPSVAVPSTPTVAARKDLQSPASGRVVRLVQARASTAQRAQTGSDRVVTPARRSTRGESAPRSKKSGRNESDRTIALLGASNYAYVPNDALLGYGTKDYL